MDSSTSVVATDVRSSGHEEEEGKKEVLMEELVLEILARLPIKSLMRFKSVSKHWYSIITSPIFIQIRRRLPRTFVSLWHSHTVFDIHTRRQAILSFLLSFEFGQDFPEQGLTVMIPREREFVVEPRIVGCSNGVVCLSISRHPQIYALWNPATKHHRQVGGGKDLGYVEYGCMYGSGFCFDPFNNCFKVVHYKLDGEGTTAIRVQVNVLSTSTNTWTGKDTEFLPYRIQFRMHNSTPTTCVDRWIHWVAPMFDPDAQLGGKMYLLSYDMISESFQRIKLPSCCSTTLYYRLAPYEHSLAVFVRRQAGPIDVWVLNDCGCANQSWAKLFTCRPSVEKHSAAGFFNKYLVLLVSSQNSNPYLYDPVSGETNKLEKRSPLLLSAAFPYSESIEPLN